MKKIIFCFTIILFLTSFCAPREGVLRWDYKILIDPDGLKLFNAKAEKTDIDVLVKLTRPEKKEMKNQRAALENQKVTIEGFIMEDGEEEDGDYHLVVKSLNSRNTLIAEIPDPETPKLKGFPGLKTSYAAVRKFVEKNIDDNPGSVRPSPNGKVKVKITGIIFFDKLAHGNGHADNGIEIHPVLAIKLVH